MLRRIALAFTLLAFGPATAHAVEYDEWTPAAAPLVVRSAPVTVALPDGRALVAGGSAPNAGGEYLPVATAELYDPQANAWTPAAPMSTPRQGAAATVLADGRVLVAGGTVKPGYWDTASAELYDPRTNTWSPAADMGYARMFHRAVALADGRVLVLGDVSNGNDPGASQLAEIYDPAANRWTGTTPMRSERGGFAVARMADGRVLVAGGRGGGEDLATADVYDPSTERWTATGPMNDTRWQSGVAVLRDGRVLIAGGSLPVWDALPAGPVTQKTAELLDPATLTWTRTGELSVARGDGATLITSATGTPVFIGGVPLVYNGYKAHGREEDSVEAYDAATGTWSFMASMANRRSGHNALTLAGGTMLVFGGYAGSERFVPSPPPVVQTPAPPVVPKPTPAPVVAGTLSFARPLPNRLKPDRSGAIVVRLRCSGGACVDKLVLRDGRRRVLARVSVKAKAGAMVTVKLKPSASVRRKLRHRKTSATLGLTEQGLNRWVTLAG